MNRVRIFALGMQEWRECAVNGVGRTWEDDYIKNEAYDRGVNVGVLLHNIATAPRRQLGRLLRAATAEREVKP